MARNPIGVLTCEPFNPNDKALLDGALLTGQPRHVRAALDHCIAWFRWQMQHEPPRRLRPSPVTGEMSLPVHLCLPPTYFDKLVQDAILQEIADSLGVPVDALRCSHNHPPGVLLCPALRIIRETGGTSFAA